ncbi:MAG: ABC transporter substrate-binding protein [Eubacteriales bacterium]
MKRKILMMTLIVCLIISMSACTTNTSGDEGNSNGDATTYPLTITDDLGNEVTFDAAPEKIVSVAPSNTEILFALELEDKLVGRSDYCNYPEEAASIESVGSYAEPNTESIINLDPDVVFSFTSVPEDAKQLLEGAGMKVVIFNPANIDGVLSNIEVIGKICNVQEKSAEIIDTMKNKRQGIMDKIATQETKTVFIDLGSFYSVGPKSFIDSILVELNVNNVAGDAETQWPQLSLEKIIEANPDVYISTYSSLEDLQAINGLEVIDAFKNDGVIVIPWGTAENDIVQRPGPRIIDGLEIYAKSIYPDAF